MAQSYPAIGLGAESGRAVAGRFDGARLALEELHRFPNGPVRVLDSLHWDVLRLWSEIQAALAARSCGGELAGIGLCTWGVDFALLSARQLRSPPSERWEAHYARFLALA
jgi:rhamnulokinase